LEPAQSFLLNQMAACDASNGIRDTYLTHHSTD
jgi:hypothetical protein